MGKLVTTIRNNFGGGLSNDKRAKSATMFSFSQHFDTFTWKNKLVPYYGTQANETKALNIVKFLYAESGTSGNFFLYGFGVESGSSRPAVYKLNIGSGASTNSWATPANHDATSGGARYEDVFFYYKDYIYMLNTRYVTRFDTSEAAGFANTYQDLTTITTAVQPLIHPNTDIAYFFINNVIYSLDDPDGAGAGWATALTLPDNLEITASCLFGNYIAIAVAEKRENSVYRGATKSTVYIWDLNSSLTAINDTVDFGAGRIIHLANLDNQIMAIVDNASGSNALDDGRIYIKKASGRKSVTLNEIVLDADINDANANALPDTPKTNFVENNKLYFPLKAPLDGNNRLGIWVVDGNGKTTVDFVEGEATSYEGIFKTGSVWWIAHSNDGSVNHSDDNSVRESRYSTTTSSVVETLVNMGDSRITSDQKWKLIGVTLMMEYLPGAGQVILEYKKDENIDGNTYVTIFTEDTNDSIRFDAINISGDTLPQFNEMILRAKSTGGAIITGIKWKVELIPDTKY